MEAVSATTRIGKLDEHRRVAGLDYILFVEPNEPLALVWSRGEDGQWREVRIESLDAMVDLPKLGAAPDMRAIYDGVAFPGNPRLVSVGASR